jgi:hypothetical protein
VDSPAAARNKMKASGPVKTRGRAVKMPVATSPTTMIGTRAVRSASQPNAGSPTSRGRRPGGDDKPERRQVDALLLEVERQDREQRAEPEPHDELGDQQRDDRAPAIEPRGGSGREPGTRGLGSGRHGETQPTRVDALCGTPCRPAGQLIRSPRRLLDRPAYDPRDGWTGRPPWRGRVPPGDEPFLRALLDAAAVQADERGGPDEPIRVVVVPTAAARHNPDAAVAFRHAPPSARRGLAAGPCGSRRPAVVDAVSADDPLTVERLSDADLIYLPGGDPDVIPDAPAGIRRPGAR